MKTKVPLLVLFLMNQGCLSWYTDNPSYKREVSNAYAEPPDDISSELGQWVATMFDAELELEVLDSHCHVPTPYTDLEFQIFDNGEQLMTYQLGHKTYRAKVYLEKKIYEARLKSFRKNDVIGSSKFEFKGRDKKVSVKVKCG